MWQTIHDKSQLAILPFSLVHEKKGKRRERTGKKLSDCDSLNFHIFIPDGGGRIIGFISGFTSTSVIYSSALSLAAILSSLAAISSSFGAMLSSLAAMLSSYASMLSSKAAMLSPLTAML